MEMVKEKEKGKKLLDYSQEIACLKILYNAGKLTEQEYNDILAAIRKAYGIVSDIG